MSPPGALGIGLASAATAATLPSMRRKAELPMVWKDMSGTQPPRADGLHAVSKWLPDGFHGFQMASMVSTRLPDGLQIDPMWLPDRF